PSAARRTAAAAEAATAATAPVTAARSADTEKEVQRDVEEQPAEPGRYDEQRQQGNGRRRDEPAQPLGRRLMVDAQRRRLRPVGGIGREHRDDVIDAARDPAVKVAGLETR